jgi:hypothetical protein
MLMAPNKLHPSLWRGRFVLELLHGRKERGRIWEGNAKYRKGESGRGHWEGESCSVGFSPNSIVYTLYHAIHNCSHYRACSRCMPACTRDNLAYMQCASYVTHNDSTTRDRPCWCWITFCVRRTTEYSHKSITLTVPLLRIAWGCDP